jgi:hypothetical protein
MVSIRRSLSLSADEGAGEASLETPMNQMI